MVIDRGVGQIPGPNVPTSGLFFYKEDARFFFLPEDSATKIGTIFVLQAGKLLDVHPVQGQD